jgi:opacity protein-like surface antigen
VKSTATLFSTTMICSLALVPALALPVHAGDPMASGFYGGLQGAIVDQRYESTSDGARPSDDSDTAASLGGLLGYQHFFGSRGYIAAEAGAFFDFGEDAHLNDNPSLIADDIHIRTNYGALFYLRPGYRLSKDTVLYGMIGAEYLRVEIDEREGATDAFNTDEGIWGFGIGAGLQFAISSQSSLRFEYRHVEYEDMDYTSLITTPTSRHIEPSRDVFAITAMFHF